MTTQNLFTSEMELALINRTEKEFNFKEGTVERLSQLLVRNFAKYFREWAKTAIERADYEALAKNEFSFALPLRVIVNEIEDSEVRFIERKEVSLYEGGYMYIVNAHLSHFFTRALRKIFDRFDLKFVSYRFLAKDHLVLIFKLADVESAKN
jgi:hypothetical protein